MDNSVDSVISQPPVQVANIQTPPTSPRRPFFRRPLFLIGLILLLFLAGISAYYYFTADSYKIKSSELNKGNGINVENDQTKIPEVSEIKISPSPKEEVVGSCEKYGESSREDYLEEYTVQKGDSLLSIAKNKLLDSSRVGELITLNKTKYPELSLGSPFIEVGWELWLPPESIDKSSGDIIQYNGDLVGKNQTYWEIQSQPYSGGPQHALYFNKDTNFEEGELFEVGDCIIATLDEDEHKTFSIEKQK